MLVGFLFHESSDLDWAQHVEFLGKFYLQTNMNFIQSSYMVTLKAQNSLHARKECVQNMNYPTQ